MVAFENLRLTGFKSFVEATDMPIRAGLTGIVGPNGCGKSNLVEALRWVMGESSAKRLRGGEMDDVIFAGAAGRPARNQAEVSLRLSNPDFDAPLQFNDETLIEVTRKVVRSQGSAYRVNGRDHRAQDLKLLFADLASGASSNAMVAQGRVSAIVNARPTDRRVLLEEAAGITGLYSRRREAENRLRAAETNLERVDDLRQSKEGQRRSLERQASAARRYSTLQAEARALGASLAYQEWLALEAALDKANGALAACSKQCEELSLAEAVAQREEATASEALEPTRMAHAEAASRMQRLELALESLAAEERGLEAKKADLARQLAEVGDDLEREKGNVTAAQERMQALEAEEVGLKERRQALKPEVAKAEVALAEQEKAERAASETLRDVSLKLSTARNERLALSSRIETLEARTASLATKLASLEVNQAFEGADESAIAAQIEAQNQLTSELETGQAARDALVTQRDEAATRQEAARAAEAAARQAAQQAMSEIEGLRAFLAKGSSKKADGPTLAQSLALNADYAKALAAVLGQEVEAGLAEAEGAYWRSWQDMPPADALPNNLPTLGAQVQQPAWLAEVLQHVGLAQHADEARALQKDLKPGQSLTTRDGGFWRWDGFVAALDEGQGATALIERRQRLVDLEATVPELEKAVAEAGEQAAAAGAAFEAARAQLKTRDEELEALRRSRDTAGANIAKAQQALAAHRAKVAAQEAERAGTAREQETVVAELTGLQQTLASQGELAHLEAQVATAQETLTTQSDALRERRVTLEAQKRDLIGVDARLGAILTETFTFEGQLRNAERQFDVLAARGKALETEAMAQAGRPQEIADKRFDLQESKQSAERERARAGDALAEAETSLRQLRAAYTNAQKAYANAREDRARLTAEQSAAQDRLTVSARAAYDQFKVPAADLLELTGCESATDLPRREEASAKLAKLERQVESIGPVNLAAESEVETLAEELERIQIETTELTQAIAKLRRVIGELNQEGRARLTAAFDQVATHFSTLFQRLFGGGKAKLELVGSTDPLEAGLEIVASPPGKRLQSLTLLSGGEQTLTALALIFAMFRANPAPLCVLDEVDAPLDDANVDRMCGLLEDMAAEVGTRFLIVTHNALTMARVDRLFGVTMAERGVSRLVSVDLESAVQFGGEG